MNSNSPYFPKGTKHEVVFGFWKKMQLKMLGKRYYDMSFPWELEGYYYKGVFYITKYQRIGL